MLDTRTIELALPGSLGIADVDIDTLDIDSMRTILRAVFGCNAEDRQDAEALLTELSAAGWSVRQGLTWVACAERGEHVERVSAPSRCEAVARLKEYASLHEVEGCP